MPWKLVNIIQSLYLRVLCGLFFLLCFSARKITKKISEIVFFSTKLNAIILALIIFFSNDYLWSMEIVEDNSTLQKNLPYSRLKTTEDETPSENSTPSLEIWLSNKQIVLSKEETKKSCILCFDPTQEKREKIVSVIGICVGAISPIAQWNLSKAFWGRIVDNTFFSTPMATLSAIPIFALAANSNKEEFLKILRIIVQSKEQKEKIKITEKKTCCGALIKSPLELFKILGGVSGSFGNAYLNYSYYYPSMNLGSLVFVIPSVITNTMIGYWALDKGFDLLYATTRYFKCNRNSSKNIIREKLERAISIIKKMEETKVDELVNKNFGEIIKDTLSVKEETDSLIPNTKNLYW